MTQEWKKTEVKNIAKLINEYNIIGILNLSKLPASQAQNIKRNVRDHILIKTVKKKLIHKAIDTAKDNKKGLDKLNEIDVAIPAIIFSNMNPFKLFSTLKKSKEKTYAKAGDTAPFDIIVPAGDTGIPPGPAIGNLTKVGIKASIQGSSIKIIADSKVISEGEVISAELADILQLVDIKPMEIGINLTALYENGTIFEKETLDLNLDEYKSQIEKAYTSSFNLAFNSGYPTKEVMPALIGEAHKNALNLAVNSNVANSETIEIFIQKAQQQMLSVASNLPEDAKGNIKTAEPQETTPKDTNKEETKEDKTEEKSEEESTSGLGALF